MVLYSGYTLVSQFYHENNEGKPTSVSYPLRQEAYQPQRQKNGFQEIEELRHSEIITDQSSEQSLEDYNAGDENKQRMMTNIMDNATNTTSARYVLQPLSSGKTQPGSGPSQIYNFSHRSVTLNIAGNYASQASLS